MQIFIKNLKGNTFTLELKQDDSVLKVKKLIQITTHIPYNKQLLFFSGKLLRDDKNISYYEIKKDSNLQLTLGLKGGMIIYVKMLTGEYMSFEVDPDGTILSLKYKIEESEGIPVHQQFLVWAGRLMENDKEFSASNISRESTLNLLVKKRESPGFMSK
jgi:ubiquitin C